MTRYRDPSKWSKRARIIAVFDELEVRCKYISPGHIAALVNTTSSEVSTCLKLYRRQEWARMKHMKGQAYQWKSKFAPLYRNIFETMVHRGYSMKELATLSGVPYGRLLKWTRYWQELKPAYLMLLCEVLDLEIKGVRSEDSDSIEEYAKPKQPEDFEEEPEPLDRFDTPASVDGWADKRKHG